MNDESFFLAPRSPWQRRYEALRASFVDRLPATTIAERFGFSPGYVRLLRHRFRRGEVDLVAPQPPRRRVTAAIRRRICVLRRRNHSAAEITRELGEGGIELSVRTIERVLAEEGFARMPRRRRAEAPTSTSAPRATPGPPARRVAALDGTRRPSRSTGLLLFAPVLARLDLDALARAARLSDAPGLPAGLRLRSLLISRLVGPRACDVRDDPAIGLLTGLRALPTPSLPAEGSGEGLQQALLALDPPPPRSQDYVTLLGHGVRGVLCRCARDLRSTRVLHTAVGSTQDPRVDWVRPLSRRWRDAGVEPPPTLVFGAHPPTHAELAQLHAEGLRFVTTSWRGRKRLPELVTPFTIAGWQPLGGLLVHDSSVHVRDGMDRLRQVVIRELGDPSSSRVLRSNCFDAPVEQLVEAHDRSRRAQDAFTRSIDYFGPTAGPAPRVHLDLVLTMLVVRLCSAIARQWGVEAWDPPTICRRLVRTHGVVEIRGDVVTIPCPELPCGDEREEIDVHVDVHVSGPAR